MIENVVRDLFHKGYMMMVYISDAVSFAINII